MISIYNYIMFIYMRPFKTFLTIGMLITVYFLKSNIVHAACKSALEATKPWITKLNKEQFRLQTIKAYKEITEEVTKFKQGFSNNIRLLSGINPLSKNEKEQQIEKKIDQFKNRLFNRIRVPATYTIPLTAQILASQYAKLSLFPDNLSSTAFDLYAMHFSQSISLTSKYEVTRFEQELCKLPSSALANRWVKIINWLRVQNKLPEIKAPTTKQYITFLSESGHSFDQIVLPELSKLILQNSAHAVYSRNSILLNRHVFDWKSINGRIIHELTHFVFKSVESTVWNWIEAQLKNNPEVTQTLDALPQMKALILKLFGEYYAQREDILWKMDVDKPLQDFHLTAAQYLNPKTHSVLFSALGPHFIVTKKLMDTGKPYSDANLVASIIVEKFYISNKNKFGSWLHQADFSEEFRAPEHHSNLKNFASSILYLLSELDPPSLEKFVFMDASNK